MAICGKMLLLVSKLYPFTVPTTLMISSDDAGQGPMVVAHPSGTNTSSTYQGELSCHTQCAAPTFRSTASGSGAAEYRIIEISITADLKHPAACPQKDCS